MGGTGGKGRILKEDVLNYLSGGKPTERAIIDATTDKAPPTPMTPVTTTLREASWPKGEDRKVPVQGVQRIMVKRMTESLKVPQFGYGDEIDMTNLVALRKSLKTKFEKLGVKVTPLSFMIKAASLALSEYPVLNATVDDEACSSMTYRADHNIGIAVDSPNGLVVPNIKQVNAKSVLEVARDIEAVVHRARNGQLSQQDITGGTFSLSNIGAFGGTYCSPIVNVPEVCIGATGTFQTLPRMGANGEFEPRQIMVVSWSADHRVIDGATVARFSNLWKEYLESPGSMLVELR